MCALHVYATERAPFHLMSCFSANYNQFEPSFWGNASEGLLKNHDQLLSHCCKEEWEMEKESLSALTDEGTYIGRETDGGRWQAPDRDRRQRQKVVGRIRSIDPIGNGGGGGGAPVRYLPDDGWGSKPQNSSNRVDMEARKIYGMLFFGFTTKGNLNAK